MCFTVILEHRGSHFKQDWKEAVLDGILLSNSTQKTVLTEVMSATGPFTLTGT